MPDSRSLLLLFFIFLIPRLVVAQSFNEGLRNYEQQDFEQAAAIFSALNSPESALFAAKSYYALRRFDKAESILNGVLQNSAPRIFYEAAYTSALVDFQQKQYGHALAKLYRVFKNSSAEELTEDAQELYLQILNFLTAKQRIAAIKTVQQPEIKFDLVETALGRVNYRSLKNIISQFYESAFEETWQKKVRDIEKSITSKAAYKIEYGDKYGAFTPPDGTIYNIGILLPRFSSDKPTYDVVQGLYLGAQLAVRRFNKTHSNAKIFLTFLPAQSRDLEEIVKGFVANSGDIIIGPLFSEKAKEIIPLSTEYDIPVIAPLATAKMRSSGSLFYQTNSNFGVHGRKMARFAVKELGFETFAVIAEQGTNGAVSARAFRKKAKALGAEVVSFKIKNFEKSKSGIKVYLKNSASKLARVDAIYAPFTSNYTSRLVEQLIYAVNTFEQPVTLLGSPKWSDVNFTTDIYARSDIYYSVNSYPSYNLSDFRYRYRRTFNERPNKYSAIGYDVSRYILTRLDKIGNPAILGRAIQKAPFYRGLIKNIYFNGKNVNQAVQILQVINGNAVRQAWQSE